MTKQEISFYDKPQTDALLNAKANTADLATVATTGDYDDLTDKPDLSLKQDKLISGTNIKTIADNSILGSGDISAFDICGMKNIGVSMENHSIGISTPDSPCYVGSGGGYNVAMGYGSHIADNSSVNIAIGLYAQIPSGGISRCIVLGHGVYAKSFSFGLAFGDYGSYELLDGTTGKIPDARLNRPVPDTTGASAGDVLALDSNKDLVWVAPSGGGISVTDHTTYITLNY